MKPIAVIPASAQAGTPALLLPREERRRIAARARAAYPLECCGFLIGRRRGKYHEVIRAKPAPNAHPSTPESAYVIAPEAYLEADRAARRSGLEILGFYHSHPDGDLRPSDRDRQEALPGCSYVIVSVRGGEAEDPGSWTLDRGGSGFVPQPLTAEATGDFA